MPMKIVNTGSYFILFIKLRRATICLAENQGNGVNDERFVCMFIVAG